MKISVGKKSLSIFISILLAVCFTRSVYAGLDLAFPIPQVPLGAITIDGVSDDWVGVDPVLDDPQGDSTCNVGTDIKTVYLAQDALYLYWRMDTWSGTYAFDNSNAGPEINFRQLPGTPTELEPGDIGTRIFNHDGLIYSNIWEWDGFSFQGLYSGSEYGWVSQIAEGRIPIDVFQDHQYTQILPSYFSGIDGEGWCDSVTTNPLPDIKANGSDGLLQITFGTPLQVDVSLNASVAVGQTADWWLVAVAPDGFYWYDISGGWVKSAVPIPTYTGALFDLAPMEVFNSSNLPVGSYWISFGVDTNANGILDFDVLFDDYVDVTIQ